MEKSEAVNLLAQLHNTCIQKGVYNDVTTVNKITSAIQCLANQGENQKNEHHANKEAGPDGTGTGKK